MNKKYFVIFALFLLLVPGVLAVYRDSDSQFFPPGSSRYRPEGFPETCEEGQDFILQIAPMGCNPTIVPSALLEEQDVNVFCQIEAYNVNPLIEIEMIKNLQINGSYPPEVRSVGFFPSRAAIDRTVYLDNSFANNIGYAVITLKQQKNASAVKELISGNLTAHILYDIEAAFGAGQVTYYLPVLGDNEFEKSRGQYTFWNNQGTLRIEEITKGSAKIDVFQEDRKIANLGLEEGQTSGYIYIPGAGCAAGFKLKLEDIDEPRTRAKIRVNEDVLEFQ